MSFSTSYTPIDVDQRLIHYVMYHCKGEILKNDDLRSLITEYFDKTFLLLEFFPLIEEFFDDTRESLIKLASIEPGKEHEIAYEEFLNIGRDVARLKDDAKKYQNLYSLYQSIRIRQHAFQVKIETKRELLEKALPPLEFCIVMFKAINVIGFILSFSMITIGAFRDVPKKFSVPLDYALLIGEIVMRWMRSVFNEKKEQLREELNVVASMHVACDAMAKHVEMIKVQVSNMRKKLHALINQQHDLRDKGKMVACAKEMKNKYDELLNTFQTLKEHFAYCTEEIKIAQSEVLKQIINYHGTGQWDCHCCIL